MNGKTDRSFEFNCSLITAFFMALFAITLGFLPAIAAHRVGLAASDALSECAAPHQSRPAEVPPINPVHGTPVATAEGETR